MDDFSKRLGEVEKAVVGIGTKLETALPNLATKADLNALRADMNAMETRMVTAMAAIETRSVATVSATENRLVRSMSELAPPP